MKIIVDNMALIQQYDPYHIGHNFGKITVQRIISKKVSFREVVFFQRQKIYVMFARAWSLSILAPDWSTSADGTSAARQSAHFPGRK